MVLKQATLISGRFPASLQHLALLDVILDFGFRCPSFAVRANHHPTANGMHIRFDSEMNAARALAKTGQFVDGNIMIGVVKFDPQKYQVCTRRHGNHPTVRPAIVA
jgi:hypothetical protein